VTKRLGHHKISVLKMDIEGHEFQVGTGTGAGAAAAGNGAVAMAVLRQLS
jgi:hypothetical protein